MILQHLTSELLKLPDSGKEVVEGEQALYEINAISTENELEIISQLYEKKYSFETQLQTKVSLQNFEANFVKAKHYVGAEEDEEDFV